MSHRFAEFAVVRDIDAELVLVPHDIGDCGSELFLKALLVCRLAGFPRAVRVEQIVRAR